MLEIPYQKLERDTLTAMIESYVLREGTDYGEQEISLEKKVNDIYLQLQSGELRILFEPNEESFNIINKEQLSQFL